MTSSLFFARGGDYGYGGAAGLFCFLDVWGTDNGQYGISFHPVLAVSSGI